MSKLTRQEAGKRGYQAVFAKYGREFHVRGGRARAALDLYTSPKDGAVGLEAALRDGYRPPKKKEV